MKFEKIGNGSVVDAVLKQIKESIMNDELKPGEKIHTEVELIEQLGVGRNSVREAIKMLVALGVLEVRRGQGTFVATTIKPTFLDPLVFSLIIEPKSNKNLYELRYLFDSMVIYNVLTKATTEDCMRLESIILEAKNAFEANERVGDYDFFVEKDLAFHEALLELTDNPLIIRIGQTILGLFPEYIKRSIKQQHGIERSIKNHLDILEIIRSKDTQQVMKITEKSLVEWKNEWKSDQSE
jgi:DNA-binding FadR family transcriptional regulator